MNIILLEKDIFVDCCDCGYIKISMRTCYPASLNCVIEQAHIWPLLPFRSSWWQFWARSSCFAVEPNMGSVRNSRCQFMLCLRREAATVQTGAAQTGGKKVAGTKTANPPPLKPAASSPLVIWPKFTGLRPVHFEI